MEEEPLGAIDSRRFEASVHAASQSTVGIVSKEIWRDDFGKYIGSGTLIEHGSRRGILTARHVVQACRLEELRFFMPRAGLVWLGTPDGSLDPRVPLAVAKRHEEMQLDIAFLEFSPEQILEEFWTFRKLGVLGSDLAAGERCLMLGYPAKLALPSPCGLTAIRRVEAPQLVSAEKVGVSTFDSRVNFVARFPSAADYDPGGFSGAGLWGAADNTKPIWTADLVYLGMVVAYISDQRLLKAIRLDRLRTFMDSLE
jgi:hypothetical protein